MKSKFTILGLSVLLCICGLGVSGCSDKDDDTDEIIVTPAMLPSEAKDFLNKYYPGIEISQVQKDEINGVVVFEVTLVNDHEIVFNTEGEWQEVDASGGGSIPAGIVPEAIQQYLDENYNGYGVNEINKTGYGYNVELVTGLDLMFNPLGECIGVGSD